MTLPADLKHSLRVLTKAPPASLSAASSCLRLGSALTPLFSLVWEPVEKTVRGEHSLSAVARLKPAVSVAQAQSKLDIIASRLTQRYPADNTGWGAKVVPLREETRR